MSKEKALIKINEVCFKMENKPFNQAVVNISDVKKIIDIASMPEWRHTDKNEFPTYGICVVAVVEWFKSKKRVPIVLKHVNEDDCSWRTADDNSELDYSLSVIKWYYMSSF